jgi:hypothetical protein
MMRIPIYRIGIFIAVVTSILIVFVGLARSETKPIAIINVTGGLIDQMEFFLIGQQIEKLGGIQLNMTYPFPIYIGYLKNPLIQGLFS